MIEFITDKERLDTIKRDVYGIGYNIDVLNFTGKLTKSGSWKGSMTCRLGTELLTIELKNGAVGKHMYYNKPQGDVIL